MAPPQGILINEVDVVAPTTRLVVGGEDVWGDGFEGYVMSSAFT